LQKEFTRGFSDKNFITKKEIIKKIQNLYNAEFCLDNNVDIFITINKDTPITINSLNILINDKIVDNFDIIIGSNEIKPNKLIFKNFNNIESIFGFCPRIFSSHKTDDNILINLNDDGKYYLCDYINKDDIIEEFNKYSIDLS